MKKKTSLAAKIMLILIALYLLVPFVATFIYSLFTEWTGILPTGFTLRNYQELFSCLLYTSPSPRDGLLSRMPSSA